MTRAHVENMVVKSSNKNWDVPLWHADVHIIDLPSVKLKSKADREMQLRLFNDNVYST